MNNLRNYLTSVHFYERLLCCNIIYTMSNLARKGMCIYSIKLIVLKRSAERVYTFLLKFNKIENINY